LYLVSASGRVPLEMNTHKSYRKKSHVFAKLFHKDPNPGTDKKKKNHLLEDGQAIISIHRYFNINKSRSLLDQQSKSLNWKFHPCADHSKDK